MDYLYGLLNLSFWGYALAALISVQITMMAVTLYLHRDQAHRALDLHPALLKSQVHHHESALLFQAV